jgi:hypothetical protein
MNINAWAAKGPNEQLEPFSYDPGPLSADDVEIGVETCGLCHSRRIGYEQRVGHLYLSGHSRARGHWESFPVSLQIGKRRRVAAWLRLNLCGFLRCRPFYQPPKSSMLHLDMV